MEEEESCGCDLQDPAQYLETLKKKYLARTAKLQSQQVELESKIQQMESYLDNSDVVESSSQCICAVNRQVPKVFPNYPEMPERDLDTVPKIISEGSIEKPAAQQCSFFQKMMENAKSILSMKCQCPSTVQQTNSSLTSDTPTKESQHITESRTTEDTSYLTDQSTRDNTITEETKPSDQNTLPRAMTHDQKGLQVSMESSSKDKHTTGTTPECLFLKNPALECDCDSCRCISSTDKLDELPKESAPSSENATIENAEVQVKVATLSKSVSNAKETANIAVSCICKNKKGPINPLPQLPYHARSTKSTQKFKNYQDGQNQCAFVGSPLLQNPDYGHLPTQTSKNLLYGPQATEATSISKLPCDCNVQTGPAKNICSVDVFSLKSKDILEMQTIAELALKEKEMKSQIQNLQRREQLYQQSTKTVKRFTGNVENERCRCCKADDGSGFENEIKKVSQELRLENNILKSELMDMKLELKHCLEKVEGPMKQKLQNEKLKCEQLQSELKNASKNMLINQDTYQREMNQLKIQLCCACNSIAELNQMNSRLKDEMSQLDCLCAKLEDDLIKQKLNEAETIKRLTNRKPDFDRPTKQSEEFKCDSSLAVVARKLSKTIKDLAPCDQCSNLPPELTGAAKCIKELTDMVLSRRRTKSPKAHHGCSCEQEPPESPSKDYMERECCSCCAGDAGDQRSEKYKPPGKVPEEKTVKTLLSVPETFVEKGASSKFDVNMPMESYYSAKGEPVADEIVSETPKEKPSIPKGKDLPCSNLGFPCLKGTKAEVDEEAPKKDKACKAPCSAVLKVVGDGEVDKALSQEPKFADKGLQQTETESRGTQETPMEKPTKSVDKVEKESVPEVPGVTKSEKEVQSLEDVGAGEKEHHRLSEDKLTSTVEEEQEPKEEGGALARDEEEPHKDEDQIGGTHDEDLAEKPYEGTPEEEAEAGAKIGSPKKTSKMSRSSADSANKPSVGGIEPGAKVESPKRSSQMSRHSKEPHEEALEEGMEDGAKIGSPKKASEMSRHSKEPHDEALEEEMEDGTKIGSPKKASEISPIGEEETYERKGVEGVEDFMKSESPKRSKESQPRKQDVMDTKPTLSELDIAALGYPEVAHDKAPPSPRKTSVTKQPSDQVGIKAEPTRGGLDEATAGEQVPKKAFKGSREASPDFEDREPAIPEYESEPERPEHAIEHEEPEKLSTTEGRVPFSEERTGGPFPYEVETKVYAQEKPVSTLHLTTAVTTSGNLEVITEGPEGAVETTLTYTPSGNIVVETQMVDYTDQPQDIPREDALEAEIYGRNAGLPESAIPRVMVRGEEQQKIQSMFPVDSSRISGPSGPEMETPYTGSSATGELESSRGLKHSCRATPVASVTSKYAASRLAVKSAELSKTAAQTVSSKEPMVSDDEHVAIEGHTSGGMSVPNVDGVPTSKSAEQEESSEIEEAAMGSERAAESDSPPTTTGVEVYSAEVWAAEHLVSDDEAVMFSDVQALPPGAEMYVSEDGGRTGYSYDPAEDVRTGGIGGGTSGTKGTDIQQQSQTGVPPEDTTTPESAVTSVTKEGETTIGTSESGLRKTTDCGCQSKDQKHQSCQCCECKEIGISTSGDKETITEQEKTMGVPSGSEEAKEDTDSEFVTISESTEYTEAQDRAAKIDEALDKRQYPEEILRKDPDFASRSKEEQRKILSEHGYAHPVSSGLSKEMLEKHPELSGKSKQEQLEILKSYGYAPLPEVDDTITTAEDIVRKYPELAGKSQKEQHKFISDLRHKEKKKIAVDSSLIEKHPELIGKSEEEQQDILRGYGYKPSENERVSPKISDREQIGAQKSVEIYVGEEMLAKHPELVGKSKSEQQALLRDMGYKASSKDQVGVVRSRDRDEIIVGEELLTEHPELVGKSKSEQQTLLRDMGYKASSKDQVGVVRSRDRDEIIVGEELLTKHPELVGKSKSEQQTLLRDMGYKASSKDQVGVVRSKEQEAADIAVSKELLAKHPELVGKSKSEQQTLLRDMGYKVSSKDQVGVVGSRDREAAEIAVSKELLAKHPELVGKSKSEQQTLLRDMGYKASSKDQVGVVGSKDGEADEIIVGEELLTKHPELVGKSKSEQQTLLRDMGYKASSKDQLGVVRSKEQETAEIAVSKELLAKHPELVGKSKSEQQTLLRDMGYKASSKDQVAVVEDDEIIVGEELLTKHPELIGKSKSEQQALLRNMGYKASSKDQVGVVRSKEREPAEIVVSKELLAKHPELVGKSKSEQQTLLRDMGYKASSKDQVGVVRSKEREPAEIVVSKELLANHPELVGKSKSEQQTLLRDMGYKASSKDQVGVVRSRDREADEISVDEELLTKHPELVGKSKSEQQRILRDMGYKARNKDKVGDQPETIVNEEKLLMRSLEQDRTGQTSMVVSEKLIKSYPKLADKSPQEQLLVLLDMGYIIDEILEHIPMSMEKVHEGILPQPSGPCRAPCGKVASVRSTDRRSGSKLPDVPKAKASEEKHIITENYQEETPARIPPAGASESSFGKVTSVRWTDRHSGSKLPDVRQETPDVPVAKVSEEKHILTEDYQEETPAKAPPAEPCRAPCGRKAATISSVNKLPDISVKKSEAPEAKVSENRTIQRADVVKTESREPDVSFKPHYKNVAITSQHDDVEEASTQSIPKSKTVFAQKKPKSRDDSASCKASCRAISVQNSHTKADETIDTAGSSGHGDNFQHISTQSVSKSKSISLQEKPSSRDDSASCKASCRTISVQSSHTDSGSRKSDRKDKKDKTDRKGKKEIKEIVAARTDSTTTSSSASDAKDKQKEKRVGEVPSIVSEVSDKERPVIQPPARKTKTQRKKRSSRVMDCLKCQCTDPCRCIVCSRDVLEQRRPMSYPTRSCDCPPSRRQAEMRMPQALSHGGHPIGCACIRCLCNPCSPCPPQYRFEGQEIIDDDFRSKVRRHPSKCECVDCLCLPKIKKIAETKEYPVVFDKKQIYQVSCACPNAQKAKKAAAEQQQVRSRIPISTTSPNPPKIKSESKANEESQPVNEKLSKSDSIYNSISCDCEQCKCAECPDTKGKAPEGTATAKRAPQTESSLRKDEDCCCTGPCICKPCPIEELTKKLRAAEAQLIAALQQAAVGLPPVPSSAVQPKDAARSVDEDCTCAQCVCPGAVGDQTPTRKEPPEKTQLEEHDEECRCPDCVCPGADIKPKTEPKQQADEECDCPECTCPEARNKPLKKSASQPESQVRSAIKAEQGYETQKSASQTAPTATGAGDDDCDCTVCACPGQTSLPKKTTPKPSDFEMADCDCPDCQCAPCADPKVSGTQAEPIEIADCDCPECKCGPCADPKVTPRAPAVEAQKPGEEHPEDCACPVCACLGEEIEPVKSKTGHPDDCDCPICQCPGETFADAKQTQPLQSQPDHPDDCACPVCQCLDEQFTDAKDMDAKPSKVSYKEASKHPPDCDCPECLCIDGQDGIESALIPLVETEVHALTCFCAQCLCPECTTTATHAQECRCKECICDPCDYRSGGDVFVKKQESGVVESKSPGHPADCSCITCNCDHCADKAKPKTAAAITGHATDCSCGTCLCEDCDDKNRAKTAAVECRCATCLCDDCFGKTKSKTAAAITGHPPDCNCTTCKCDDSVDMAKPKTAAAKTDHEEECSCIACICDYCVDEIKPKTVAAIESEKPKSGGDSNKGPNCTCETCICIDCKGMSLNKCMSVEHDETCKCPDCICSPCLKQSGLTSVKIALLQAQTRPTQSQMSSKTSKVRSTNPTCKCSRCTCKEWDSDQPTVEFTTKGSKVQSSQSVPVKQSKVKSVDQMQHDPDCDCPVCACMEAEVEITSDYKQQVTQNVTDCACPVCKCESDDTGVPIKDQTVERKGMGTVEQGVPIKQQVSREQHDQECTCPVCKCEMVDTGVPTKQSVLKQQVSREQHDPECTCPVCECEMADTGVLTQEQMVTRKGMGAVEQGVPIKQQVSREQHDQDCTCPVCQCETADVGVSMEPMKSKVSQKISREQHDPDCICPVCACSTADIGVPTASIQQMSAKQSKISSAQQAAALQSKPMSSVKPAVSFHGDQKMDPPPFEVPHRIECNCERCDCVICAGKSEFDTQQVSALQSKPMSSVKPAVSFHGDQKMDPPPFEVPHRIECNCERCDCVICAYKREGRSSPSSRVASTHTASDGQRPASRAVSAHTTPELHSAPPPTVRSQTSRTGEQAKCECDGVCVCRHCEENNVASRKMLQSPSAKSCPSSTCKGSGADMATSTKPSRTLQNQPSVQIQATQSVQFYTDVQAEPSASGQRVVVEAAVQSAVETEILATEHANVESSKRNVHASVHPSTQMPPSLHPSAQITRPPSSHPSGQMGNLPSTHPSVRIGHPSNINEQTCAQSCVQIQTSVSVHSNIEIGQVAQVNAALLQSKTVSFHDGSPSKTTPTPRHPKTEVGALASVHSEAKTASKDFTASTQLVEQIETSIRVDEIDEAPISVQMEKGVMAAVPGTPYTAVTGAYISFPTNTYNPSPKPKQKAKPKEKTVIAKDKKIQKPSHPGGKIPSEGDGKRTQAKSDSLLQVDIDIEIEKKDCPEPPPTPGEDPKKSVVPKVSSGLKDPKKDKPNVLSGPKDPKKPVVPKVPPGKPDKCPCQKEPPPRPKMRNPGACVCCTCVPSDQGGAEGESPVSARSETDFGDSGIVLCYGDRPRNEDGRIVAEYRQDVLAAPVLKTSSGIHSKAEVGVFASMHSEAKIASKDFTASTQLVEQTETSIRVDEIDEAPISVQMEKGVMAAVPGTPYTAVTGAYIGFPTNTYNPSPKPKQKAKPKEKTVIAKDKKIQKPSHPGGKIPSEGDGKRTQAKSDSLLQVDIDIEIEKKDCPEPPPTPGEDPKKSVVPKVSSGLKDPKKDKPNVLSGPKDPKKPVVPKVPPGKTDKCPCQKEPPPRPKMRNPGACVCCTCVPSNHGDVEVESPVSARIETGVMAAALYDRNKFKYTDFEIQIDIEIEIDDSSDEESDSGEDPKKPDRLNVPSGSDTPGGDDSHTSNKDIDPEDDVPSVPSGGDKSGGDDSRTSNKDINPPPVVPKVSGKPDKCPCQKETPPRPEMRNPDACVCCTCVASDHGGAEGKSPVNARIETGVMSAAVLETSSGIHSKAEVGVFASMHSEAKIASKDFTASTQLVEQTETSIRVDEIDEAPISVQMEKGVMAAVPGTPYTAVTGAYIGFPTNTYNPSPKPKQKKDKKIEKPSPPGGKIPPAGGPASTHPSSEGDGRRTPIGNLSPSKTGASLEIGTDSESGQYFCPPSFPSIPGEDPKKPVGSKVSFGPKESFDPKDPKKDGPNVPPGKPDKCPCQKYVETPKMRNPGACVCCTCVPSDHGGAEGESPVSPRSETDFGDSGIILCYGDRPRNKDGRIVAEYRQDVLAAPVLKTSSGIHSKADVGVFASTHSEAKIASKDFTSDPEVLRGLPAACFGNLEESIISFGPKDPKKDGPNVPPGMPDKCPCQKYVETPKMRNPGACVCCTCVPSDHGGAEGESPGIARSETDFGDSGIVICYGARPRNKDGRIVAEYRQDVLAAPVLKTSSGIHSKADVGVFASTHSEAKIASKDFTSDPEVLRGLLAACFGNLEESIISFEMNAKTGSYIRPPILKPKPTAKALTAKDKKIQTPNPLEGKLPSAMSQTYNPVPLPTENVLRAKDIKLQTSRPPPAAPIVSINPGGTVQVPKKISDRNVPSRPKTLNAEIETETALLAAVETQVEQAAVLTSAHSKVGVGGPASTRIGGPPPSSHAGVHPSAEIVVLTSAHSKVNVGPASTHPSKQISAAPPSSHPSAQIGAPASVHPSGQIAGPPGNPPNQPGVPTPCHCPQNAIQNEPVSTLQNYRPIEQAHPCQTLCDCLACQCAPCPDPPGATTLPLLDPGNKESIKSMDNSTLKENIQAIVQENRQCRQQIAEIKQALESIKCACVEAEFRSAHSTGQSAQSLKPFVKQASNFGQTMSGLKMALRNLQAKCRAKDKMIEAMTGELEVRGGAEVFSKVLERSQNMSRAPDYDQGEDVRSTDRSQIATNILYAPTVTSERGSSACACDTVRDVQSRGVEARTHKHKKKKEKPGNRVSCSCSKHQMIQKRDQDCQMLDPISFEVLDIRRITEDSLIVKWTKPSSDRVTGYDLFVNGTLSSKVMSAVRTSAMMHSLDLSKTVQITVYAVSRCGRIEPPAIAIYEINSKK
ncbi:uncharacterized protein LOC115879012 isoform X3 [Sitophilus oryzae]|uniref:Uncharacterized protein LOC115879012 isoform X3 n=1 Tax=Sitophilus oryzae TaxID=7048 RepID=A0A6J2XLF8_SITOR|nr:uncharacterized protein LOC115879012 isoform X3 [Sitophilus oryzae]